MEAVVLEEQEVGVGRVVEEHKIVMAGVGVWFGEGECWSWVCCRQLAQ